MQKTYGEEIIDRKNGKIVVPENLSKEEEIKFFNNYFNSLPEKMPKKEAVKYYGKKLDAVWESLGVEKKDTTYKVPTIQSTNPFDDTKNKLDSYWKSKGY